MKFLAVNYHYFCSGVAPRGRAIFPVSSDAFAAQLELLGESFDFVSRERLLAAVRGSAPLPARACMITFDDGLRQQYEIALPILRRLDVDAVFFVPGRPLAEGRAVATHKVHYARERLSDARCLEIVAQSRPSLPHVPTEAARRMYRYDDPEAAQVKYLLNVVLDERMREEVADALFREVHDDETAFCRDLYMTEEQLVELEHEHGAIGAHGYAHVPLAQLPHEDLRNDLSRSSAALGAITGASPLIVSYPYGSVDAVSDSVATVAASLGFLAGFTMERAFNRTLAEPLLLARIDVNDAPGGRNPLFSVGVDGVVVGEAMAAERALHFDERAFLSVVDAPVDVE